MSKSWFFLIPFLGVVILTFVVYSLPQGASAPSTGDGDQYLSLVKDRYQSIAKMLASYDLVIDGILMEDQITLDAILAKIKKNESDLTYVNITNPGNDVIASLDTLLSGKKFTGQPGLKPLTNEPILIQETSASAVKQLHYSLPILSAGKKIANLYLGTKVNLNLPTMRTTQVKTKKSPLTLGVGAAFAVVLSLIVLAMTGSFKSRVLDQLVEKQEHLFSPKIAALKKEEENLKSEVDKLDKQKNDLVTEITAAQMTVDNLKGEYETVRQQIEQNPVTQSIEKLKAVETEVLKRLEGLKSEHEHMSKEIEIEKVQYNEVLKTLEAERLEEKALHDRLDLIKKKILRLEG